MAHYMAELVLTGRPVLVIGGGRVARRKLAGLLTCRAEIRVVAPRLDDWVAEQARAGRLIHLPGVFDPARLTAPPRPVLVFAATDRAETNREIARLCAEQGLLCNSADDPRASGFLVPAVIRRGPVAVGVATEGSSPALSRLLKERIDRWLEPGWAALAELFGRKRGAVKARIADIESRQRFWRETALAVEAEGRFRLAENGGAADNAAWFDNRLEKAAGDG